MSTKVEEKKAGRPRSRGLKEMDMGWETPCHLWDGCKLPNGYGFLVRDGKGSSAHRWHYEQHVGHELPPEVVVHHHCEVRSCCNPEHLKPVTYAKNTQMGRGAKITSKKADAIRAFYESGFATQAELGKLFNLSQPSISRLVNFYTWRPDN
jgi:HNH endonuclease